MPASPKQAQAVELVRKTIWCFYRGLKLWKLNPSPSAEASFRQQFNRIFGQQPGTRNSTNCSPVWPGGKPNYYRSSSVPRSPCTPMHLRTTCGPG